jgi:3-deoxy-7-phosphoheptulonate synthase
MNTLPSPNRIQAEIPLTVTDRQFVLKSRTTAKAILDGEDPRILLIVGPCSLYDTKATLEYAEKLKALSLEVADTFFIIMRAYCEKPRTAMGWRGLMHDPYLDGSYHIGAGIRLSRTLMREIASLEIPLATEYLDLSAPLYFDDLMSWGCIGARTVASPLHRQMASHLTLPMGFKNTPEGSIETALEAIQVAKSPHTFIAPNGDGVLSTVKSNGNPYSHLVLRGGKSAPNYTPDIIEPTLQKTPCLVIDCSHDNSRKIPKNQLHVFQESIRQIEAGQKGIRGLMLESFLHEGNQPLSPFLKHGTSLTDPCLDFEATRALILEQAERLQLCFV